MVCTQIYKKKNYIFTYRTTMKLENTDMLALVIARERGQGQEEINLVKDVKNKIQ